MKASWERGRPARTKPGTASAISSTWINRERRHGSPAAWSTPFPQTGWLATASHGSSAAAKGTGCGRDARAPRRCSTTQNASTLTPSGEPQQYLKPFIINGEMGSTDRISPWNRASPRVRPEWNGNTTFCCRADEASIIFVQKRLIMLDKMRHPHTIPHTEANRWTPISFGLESGPATPPKTSLTGRQPASLPLS